MLFPHRIDGCQGQAHQRNSIKAESSLQNVDRARAIDECAAKHYYKCFLAGG